MKNYLIVIILLLAAFSHRDRQPQGKEYIEIVYGNGPKRMRPLVISKRKLNIKLDDTELDEYKRWRIDTSTVKLEVFISMKYELLITDENTYALLLAFIKNNPEFYNNNIDRTSPYGFNRITANGKIYDLFYKTKSDFLKKLVTTLKLNNCDKKVINALEEKTKYW